MSDYDRYNRISKNKIPSQTFFNFLLDYRSGRYPKYRGLRLGQAFLNEFYPRDIFPNLFYAQDQNLAMNIIEENYVDYSN